MSRVATPLQPNKTALIRRGVGVVKAAWSPCGQHVASADANGVVLWQAETGKRLGEWSRIGSIYTIVWSPTGEHLAVGSVLYKRPLRHGSVRLWRFPTAASLERSTKKKPLSAAADPVAALTWSPDGARLALPLSRSKVAIQDVLAESLVLEYETNPAVLIEDMAWSPNGTYIATIGSNIHASHHTMSVYRAADGTAAYSQPQTHLTSVSWSPDSSRLVIADHNKAVLWDIATAQVVGAYTGHAWKIFEVAWSPDGRSIASASDHAIHIWDAQTGQTLSVHTFPGYNHVTCVAWSPDGQHLVAGDSGRAVHIWSPW